MTFLASWIALSVLAAILVCCLFALTGESRNWQLGNSAHLGERDVTGLMSHRRLSVSVVANMR
jgi:hypothetical protein